MDEFSNLLGPLDRIPNGFEGAIARKLISFLSIYPNTSHVSIQLVRQLISSSEEKGMDAAILRTLQFLAGDGVQLLEPRFELIEPDRDPIELSEEEVSAVMEVSVNPRTGEFSLEVKDQVFLYFRPTPLAKSFATTLIESERIKRFQ